MYHLLVIHEFAGLCSFHGGLSSLPIQRYKVLLTNVVDAIQAISDSQISRKHGYSSNRDYFQSVFGIDVQAVFTSLAVYQVRV